MNTKQWQNLIKKLGWTNAYTRYLSSSSWRNKREQRLEIDQWECRTCGSKENLEIHHKPQAYKNIPNENAINDLTTLCKSCHEVITSLIRQRRYQSRNIEIQFYKSPREGERKLSDYGMANSKLQIDRRKPPSDAQWTLGKSTQSYSESTEIDLWKTKKDRGRLRGIG